MQLLEIFKKIRMRQRRIAALMGLDLFDENFKPTKAYFVLANAILYYIVNAYSMVKFSNELVTFVFCLVTYGIGIQGGDKLRIYIYHRSTILALEKCLFEFHKDNDELPIKLQIEIKNELRFCEIIVKLVNTVYFVSGPLVIIITCGIMVFTDAERLLMFGFVLPGIDYKTSPGYEINFIFQLIQVYCICVGTNSSDAYYAFFLLHGRMQISVIIGRLKILNNLIAAGESAQEQSRVFNEIIEKHITLTWYLRNLENNFRLHFLILIITASVQVTLTIFVLLTTTWYIGILMLIQGELQLLIVCLLGTMLSIKCDELEREIYNIEWYSMEITERKKLVVFLQMAQNPIEQSFGGLGYLSLHTFLEVNKSIYSYLMVFLSYV